ncbi:MAG: methyltransferase type 11, partial [Desulfovibrio sp.]|nr:methyltransferase type 11 [Desulfovibrio sp.]
GDAGPAPSSCLKGALSLERLETLIQDCGFAVLCREDHSAALKQLAAAIVFACGSLENFREIPHGADSRPAACFRPPRAGYVLFVAKAV